MNIFCILIFRCDANVDRIESVRVDGSDRRIVISDMIEHPFGLAVFQKHLYWTDWEENILQRADKHTGEVRTILVSDHFLKKFSLSCTCKTRKSIYFKIINARDIFSNLIKTIYFWKKLSFLVSFLSAVTKQFT